MNKKKRSTMLKWIVMIEVVLILMIVNIVLVLYLDKACSKEAEPASIKVQKAVEIQELTEESHAAAAKKAAASMGEESLVHNEIKEKRILLFSGA